MNFSISTHYWQCVEIVDTLPVPREQLLLERGLVGDIIKKK